jgi:prophage tail gpP-like protein
LAKKKPKYPPLTAAEIKLAKLYNRWYGCRKEFLSKSDLPPGNEFTNKNYGDLTDQFLANSPAIMLDTAELALLVRRYRAMKMVATKAKNKRAEERRRARELKAAKKETARLAREAKLRRVVEFKAKQFTLTL